MSWFYRALVRPVLFAQEPEAVHQLTLDWLGWVGRHEILADALATFCGAPELPATVFGLRFPNPIGLAAGMDKEGVALPAWEALGFGHCELGAATWQAQPGNPPPRLFRIVPDQAIINRMGFNNLGAAALAERLAQWRAGDRWPHHPVGINLGKSKLTPLDQASEDYARSLRVLWPHADFFVVNVSSPNTPNLRQLQDKAALDEILAALQQVQRELLAARSEPDAMVTNPSPVADGSRITDHAPKSPPPPTNPAIHQSTHPPIRPSTHPGSPAASPRPILVKVAPDLSFTALDEVLELVGPRQVAGLVATNTTVARPETPRADLSRVYAETGGLSGKPLRARSTEVIRHLYRQSQGRVPLVGVGGIFNAQDAWEKIAAGASLLQIYTSLVYEGPGLVKQIVTGLVERLGQSGAKSLDQAVGCENT